MTSRTDTAERDAEIERLWAIADGDDAARTIESFERLHRATPEDPVLAFELASAHDWAGDEAEALCWYERALAGGLDPDRDLRARIQYGSSLRNVGRFQDAVRVLDEAVKKYPASAAARCFRALAMTDTGHPRLAVAELLELVVDKVTDRDVQGYGRALRSYADDLRR